MKRTLIKDLSKHLDQKVKVRGWLNNLRSLGKVGFLLLRDGSGFIQIVIENSEELKRLSALQPGSILSIEGKVVSSSSQFQLEIVEPLVVIENAISEISPIEYYKPEIPSDLEFILDHRTIALRNRQLQAIFKIQAEIVHAFRLYMHDQVGAVEYFAPNLIGASSEGGAEFFNVDYFGNQATLAQSSQLYKQIMVGVNEKVFALMPFFRAEPSHTTRHLSEGKQFEFEMGFFDHWHEILDIQEGLIKSIIKHLNTHCQKELETLHFPLVKAPEEVPFPRLTFQEAQELYYQRTKVDERNEPDLSPAAERELCRWAFEQFKTELVFVTDWKREKRPFYAFPNEKNPELTNTFDLLCAGTEITSGGQRRHTYESMLEGIVEKKMDPAHFEDYLSIFRYGMPPHGGFGMGMERLTMTLLKLKNIREASLFPSDTKRIASNRIRAHIFFGEENIRNEIIRKCRQKKVIFEHLIHEKTTTSSESSGVRNTPMEWGVKALILRGKSSKKNYQFNLSANEKLDMKAVTQITGEKCEFEDPIIIKERYGLTIGGVPPFGNLLDLDNYFDQKILEKEKAVFNCGLLTESIIMQPDDLAEIAEAKWAVFSKTES